MSGICDELKPCPFCGCEDIDEYEGDFGNGVYCMNCGAMMGEPIHMEFRTNERVSYEQAIEAWNTRATLGGGECECDGTIEWRWTGPTTYYEHELSCGHVITSVDNEPPKFCEECGARVLNKARKAVKRCVSL